MIGLEQGLALRATGLRWEPAAGDHFVIPDRDMDGRVFVISHMVVEVIETAAGPMIAFNGTTEWALDSIEVGEVVWLPLEHQLRELLGDAFVGLDSIPSQDPTTRGYAVTARVGVASERFVDVTVASAYTRALLGVRRAAG